MSKAALKTYRKSISDAWLSIVGRRRLTSAEYVLVEQWFNEQMPIDLILRAIRQVASRAVPVYSLGVIKADLVALQKQQSKTRVGDDPPKKPEAEWRRKWSDDLLAIIEGENNPRRKALYQWLYIDLPELTLDQAQARYHEARQAL